MISNIKKLIKELDKETLLRVFVYVFVLGLIAHGFCYFNGNFSGDSLFYLYRNDAKDMVAMGRYIRPVYGVFKGKLTMPVVNGMLSLFFISISSYLVIDIFKIKNKYFKFFVCAILTVNSSISLLNASYIHDSDAYMFSLMLSLFASKLLISNNKANYFLTCIILIVSLGIYQSFVEVTIFVVIAVAIKEIINRNDIKIIFKDLFTRILIIVLSLALYYALYILLLKVFNIEKTISDNSIGNISIFSFGIIRERIYNLFISEIRWVINPRSYNNYLIKIINVVIIVIGLYCLVRIMLKNKLEWAKYVIVAMLLLFACIGTNITTFIANNYHDLTLYPFNMLYIFVLTLIEDCCSNNCGKNILISVLYIVFALLIIDGSMYSNEIYLKKDLENKSTLSLYTRVLDRIEKLDGYQVGETKLAFIGTIKESDMNYEIDGFDYSGIGINNSFSAITYEKTASYFKYYLGFNGDILTKEESMQYANDQDINKLLPFPNQNCVVLKDGIVFIKFSNN